MRLFYLLFSSAIGLGCMLLLELFELRIEHGSGNDTGCNIRNRHAVPHAFYSPKERKNQQAGNQNQYLSAQGKDDGFLSHADTLEEVGGHHLKTDDGENRTTTCNPFALSCMSCVSVVKADTASSGISSPTRKPLVVTMVAAMTVYFMTWFTRW